MHVFVRKWPRAEGHHTHNSRCTPPHTHTPSTRTLLRVAVEAERRRDVEHVGGPLNGGVELRRRLQQRRDGRELERPGGGVRRALQRREARVCRVAAPRRRAHRVAALEQLADQLLRDEAGRAGNNGELAAAGEGRGVGGCHSSA